jgi:SSS family solute:Na+ symporter
MTITFGIIVLIMIGISLSRPPLMDEKQPIEINKKDFQVTPAFIMGSVIIMGILAGLYTVFW